MPLLAGLLVEADITPQDTLVGLGGGAAWIDNIFAYLYTVRVTDVFRAVEYLDLIMQALHWSEERRAQHKRDWYRADVSARDWLNEHLPSPDVWFTWDEGAVTALNYLEKRLDSMDYPLFKAKGFPFGSGQVEGMNKHVVGSRIKRSGIHWSQTGAASMASLRAQTYEEHPFVSFDSPRFDARSRRPRRACCTPREPAPRA